MADLGTDVSATTGLDPNFTLVTGTRSLAEAALRRLTTQRGTLFYAPNYGTDVREALLARLDADGLRSWRKRIEGELQKDDRVRIVRANLSFSQASGVLTIGVSGVTGEGPFAFTIAASALSADLLPLG
jgi:hypothetical protein